MRRIQGEGFLTQWRRVRSKGSILLLNVNFYDDDNVDVF